MKPALASAGASANSGTARSCGKSRNSLRANYLVMQKARGLFPYKTAQHIAEITGYPQRTVEYWLSKDRLPGEAIGALIASEHGFEFVEAIAERTSWWRKVRRALAQTNEKINRVREAHNAATELAAAITRATSAMGLQCEDLDSAEDRAMVRRTSEGSSPARRR